VFPHCLQHMIANLVGGLDGEGQLLLGAVVDGPSQSDNFSGLGVPDNTKRCPTRSGDPFKIFSGNGVRYKDDVSAWPSSEPSLDYSVLQIYSYARLIRLDCS